ncbi:Avirulence (Avh) protein [Phytophthora megakarya]|uniref:Avirulence (Avh) protein n=1 Tax=Phytophthora megakarya TaxID=4795 RepID=A0A225WBW3_9STRA|nr:Avirulence (Avh) protein [Phytophthora megakarya]
MRLFHIVLLVVAYHTCIHALTHDTISIKTPQSRTTTKKLIRTESTNLDSIDGKVGTEERASPSKLLDIDKKTWSMVKFDNKLSNKIWAAAGKNPEKLFKYFRLDRAGENIDEKRKIIHWFRFARDYRAAKGIHWLPDYKIYSILSGTSEAKRALLFQSLKEIPDVKDLATIMQNYQFKLWIDRGEIPGTVATMMRIPKSKPLNTEFNPSYKILEDFTKEFTGKKLTRSTTMR